MADISVSEARQSDLDSLTTIVTRSFHPVNPYIKRALPDTPELRAWWSRIFEDEMREESCHVLVALDSKTNKDIGVLTLRLLAPNDKGAGFWTMYPLTQDHEWEKYRSMVDGMVEARERLMLGRPHYLIELFGVDNAFKGRGVGTKLLARACEIGDEAGHDTFVQSNASARDFYMRLGFSCDGEAVMPGEPKYIEYMMIRRCKK